jgi:hypothetical protein
VKRTAQPDEAGQPKMPMRSYLKLVRTEENRDATLTQTAKPAMRRLTKVDDAMLCNKASEERSETENVAYPAWHTVVLSENTGVVRAA